jgi:hypothetical protein
MSSSHGYTLAAGNYAFPGVTPGHRRKYACRKARFVRKMDATSLSMTFLLREFCRCQRQDECAVGRTASEQFETNS